MLAALPAKGNRAVFPASGYQNGPRALIADPVGRIFAQKRAADRRLFPGCWDIAGGHVEPGESLEAALRREVAEETGREVRILALLHIFDWSTGAGADLVRKREFDFLVEAQGT